MSDEKKQFPQGVLISGICKGVREETYNNNTNRYIGFDVTTLDQYGQPRSQLEEVAIFGDKEQELADKARQSVGKHCVISVIKRASKSQAGNAYMRTMINRESQLMVIG
jgi:hypothetical protein